MMLLSSSRQIWKWISYKTSLCLDDSSMGLTQIHINYNLKYAFGNDVGLIPFITETVTRVYVTKGVTNIVVTNFHIIHVIHKNCIHFYI